jgi:hypothetical protein
LTAVVEPCRLFVYLASEAPVAAVLSRGPTDWAQLSLWQTDSDRIAHGQWIKGRVYERRSDLSPDGTLFAAFVRQSGGREPGGADTWVAISRPPYFSALAVWFVGGTYYTGAFFPARNTLWLGYQEETPPDRGDKPGWLTIRSPRDIAYVDRTAEWTDRTVHFNRLLRDGWELVERESYRTLWRRRHRELPLVLNMLHSFEDGRRQGGRYLVEYTLWNEAEQRELSLGEATWADWDQRGRLVLARDGQLLLCAVETGACETIADFNGRKPDPQPAPPEALEWPRSTL